MKRKAWIALYTAAALVIVGGSVATYTVLRGKGRLSGASNHFATTQNTTNTLSGSTGSSVGVNNANVTVNITSSANVSGYLYTSPSKAQFFQIVSDQGQLSGSVSEAYVGPGNTFLTASSPISGTVSGVNVSITVESTHQVYTGQLTSGSLELTMPQGNGSVQTLVFAPDTMTDYQADVAQVQQTVAANQTQAAQLQQQDLLSKEKGLVDAYQQVLSDTSGVQADLQRTASDFSKQSSDLSKTNQALQLVLAETGAQQTSDAAKVQSDATAVSFDSNTIQSDQFALSNDLGTLQQDTLQLQSADQNAKNLLGQLKTKPIAGFPTQVAVNHAESVAAALTQNAKSQISRYVSQSQQMLQQANSDAAQAAKAAGTSQ